jgi:hypothetical protein
MEVVVEMVRQAASTHSLATRQVEVAAQATTSVPTDSVPTAR